MPSAVRASARSVGSRTSWPSTVRCLLRSLWIMSPVAVHAPSMRLEIKPHSGILSFFFTVARTFHACDQPFCLRVLACSSSAFFLPRRTPLTCGWGRAAGEKECCSADASSTPAVVAGVCHRVGWRLVRPGRYARTTVYPCDAGQGAITRYLVRALRTGRHIESPPIERTVPLQVTRRQNGDSLRLASLLRPRRSRPPSLA